MSVAKSWSKAIRKIVSFRTATLLILAAVLVIAPVFYKRIRKEKHVSVCFYGINRSLGNTYSSIRENILKPFWRSGYKVHLYYHTYNLTKLINRRSNENATISLLEYSLIGSPEGFRVTNQEEFLQRFELQQWIVRGTDPWNDDFQSMKNLAAQLNSISECYDLMAEKHVYSSQIFILLRPDMLYLNPIVVEDVERNLNDTSTWILPNFLNAQSYWNDRFIITNIGGLYPWCKRLHLGSVYAKEKSRSVHAESLVKFSADVFKINAEYIDMKMVRVRAGGHISSYSDKLLLEEWNLGAWIDHTCVGPCM